MVLQKEFIFVSSFAAQQYAAQGFKKLKGPFLRAFLFALPLLLEDWKTILIFLKLGKTGLRIYAGPSFFKSATDAVPVNHYLNTI